jgi:hypothetical protein
LEQRFSSIATSSGPDSVASLDAVSNQAVVKQASHFGSSASNSSFVQTAGKVKRDMAASSSGGYKPMPKPFPASHNRKRPVFCYPNHLKRKANTYVMSAAPVQSVRLQHDIKQGIFPNHKGNTTLPEGCQNPLRVHIPECFGVGVGVVGSALNMNTNGTDKPFHSHAPLERDFPPSVPRES